MGSIFLSFDFGLFEIYNTEKLESYFKLEHTRIHESRADEWGLKLLHVAGFDITQAPEFIVSFDRTASLVNS